ncbi:VIT1/CCC1 transporter family protein [Candidatus Woesearchaeota archaeon]|nr:VIT1/CCC1 transporter family protein [Candidatus Woesearchaeota archaeon]
MIRLAIRGLVDGSLSSLGVVIGAAISENAAIILSAGLAGATANGFSNILAAITAEKIGKYQDLQKVQKKMLRSLKGTTIETKIGKDVLRGGLIDGVLSIVGGIIPLLPFFFLDVIHGLYVAIGLVTLLAAVLGAYTGHFSKENIFFSIGKMVFFTLIAAGICASIMLLF